MDCNQSRTLSSPYIDGELAADRFVEFEQHLDTCPSCRALYDTERRMSALLRARGERFTAPAHLKARIRSQIERKSRSPFSDLRWLFVGWNPVALAASLVVVVALTAEATLQFAGAGSHEALLAREVVSGYVRSRQADHLTDVASSDRHTVEAWFSDKLDFSLPVTDLTGQGFPLVGGRLDYLDNRAVPALIYRHGQHVINVFAWPESGEEQPRFESRQGYNLAYYKHGGMEFWAASDANAAELKDFINQLRTARESAT